MRSLPSKFKVQIIIEPDGKGFYARCPALKGLHTWGKTTDEAIKNAKDAAIAYIESLIDEGKPIPVGIIEEPTHFKKIQKSESHIEDLILV